jgi:hypothetical protein
MYSTYCICMDSFPTSGVTFPSCPFWVGSLVVPYVGTVRFCRIWVKMNCLYFLKMWLPLAIVRIYLSICLCETPRIDNGAGIRVADPHHLNEDPYQGFHLNADPVAASILSLHGPPRLALFWAFKASRVNFDFYADPIRSSFQDNADQDPPQPCRCL